MIIPENQDIDNEFNINSANRFVAFVDILGFRNQLQISHDEFISTYRKVFKPLEDEIQTLGIRHTLFSDSLFICVENRSPDVQLTSLLIFAKKLLERSISVKLPIRGAISYGRVLWGDDVLVGMPIIEAVEQESLQNWLGIILSSSCANYCSRVDKKSLLKHYLNKRLIVKYNRIPIKNNNGINNYITGYVINFVSDSDHAANILQTLESMKITACSVEAELKYNETEKFVEYLLKDNQLLLP